MLVEPLETNEERQQREYEEWAERESRRRPPRKSGWAKGPPRCGACPAFIANPSSPCKACGFLNGLGRFPL